MTILEITIQRRGEAGYPVVAELSAGGGLPTEGLLRLDRLQAGRRGRGWPTGDRGWPTCARRTWSRSSWRPNAS